MALLRDKAKTAGPVIGVFSPIDGRKAAIDLQQDRVMARMQYMAGFIDQQFQHIDGSRSHVVVADEPIKDAVSAMRVGRYFHEQAVSIAVGFSDVWAYPGELDGLLLQNLSMGQVPLLQVSGNSATWPGVVSNFAVTGMEAPMGYLSHRIIGDVDEDTGGIDIQEGAGDELIRGAVAVAAIVALEGVTVEGGGSDGGGGPALGVTAGIIEVSRNSDGRERHCC